MDEADSSLARAMGGKLPPADVSKYDHQFSTENDGFTAWAPVPDPLHGVRARGQRRSRKERRSVGQLLDWPVLLYHFFLYEPSV